MKKIKIAAVALVIALLVGVFAACSGNDTPISDRRREDRERAEAAAEAGRSRASQNTNKTEASESDETGEKPVSSLPEDILALSNAVISNPSATTGSYAFEDYAMSSIT